MNSENLSRKEKIAFLKGVQAGTKNADDLKETCAVIIKHSDNTYTVQTDGRKLTEAQLEDFAQGMETIIILPDNGRDLNPYKTA